MAHDYTLRQLGYFIAAADTGTTAKAAEQSRLTQSAMSAALTDLERTLGVQLFTRTRGRGLALTAVGRELLPEARRLAFLADDFGQTARDLGDGLSGTVTVGCFESLSAALLPSLIGAFEQRYPGTMVEIIEGPQDELHDAIRDGRIELAILYATESMADLAQNVMFEPTVHVVLSREHPLADRPSVSLAELVDDPLVMLTTNPALGLIRSSFAQLGLTPTVRFSTRSFELARALVQEGMGYAVIAEPFGEQPRHWNRNVIAVPVSDPLEPPPVVLAHIGGARLTRRARAFREFCGRRADEVANPETSALPRPLD